MPFEPFSRQCGSAVLLTYGVRTGLLSSGWVTALGHRIARGTHSLMQKLPATGEISLPRQKDWDDLELQGRMVMALPWARSVQDAPWQVVGRRAVSDIVINDYTVSVKHARIRRTSDGEKLAIIDLGSTNGSEVNDVPLRPNEEIIIGSRAVIAFGRQQFLFLLVRDFYDLLTGDGTVTAWDGRAI
jgi:hypothetical protein